jgi:hypothetical protein
MKMKVKWFDRFLKNTEEESCDCGKGPQESRQDKNGIKDSIPSCCGSGNEVESTGGETSKKAVPCCGGPSAGSDDTGMALELARIKKGEIFTEAGPVPRVSARLRPSDRLGTWKVRCGIGRMGYALPPGLYAIGKPDANSPVFVSANYKMSFDRLRSALNGVDGWILVLDTKGINVWCAAGKGSFGTDELVSRIGLTSIAQVVAHRELILPQLGAPGIAAHEVKKRTGFKVTYGPVRASDLPDFLAAGSIADSEMRRVRFPLRARAVLAPVELVGVLKHPIALSLLAIWIFSLLGVRFLSFDFPAMVGAVVIGALAVPLFLPWIPFRAFAAKGWFLGVVWAAAAFNLHSQPDVLSHNWLEGISYLLILPAISAFLAMNFTGSSTITSLSGVVKEMRTAVPMILISLVFGLAAALGGLILI